MDCNLFLLLFSVRPDTVLRQAVTLISVSLLVIGLYITVNTSGEKPFVPETNCAINKYVMPEKSSIHPECFLRRYCLKYDIQPRRNVCRSDISVRLFVFIFSLPSNFKRRQMIRSSWLSSSHFKDNELSYVFLLGYERTHKDTRIYREAETYGDIVLVDFQESFCHLTLKGIAGLHFTTTFCPNAKFVMKTDDDIFINMFLLQNMLKGMMDSKKTEKVLMGLVWIQGDVFRSGRYALSKLQYARNTYPPFCSGSSYTMSIDVTKLLYKLAMQDNRRVLIHLDDPYITGILAHRAKLTHIQIRPLYLVYKSDYRRFSDASLLKYMVLHIHDEDVIVGATDKLHMDLWRRLVILNKNNSTYAVKKVG